MNQWQPRPYDPNWRSQRTGGQPQGQYREPVPPQPQYRPAPQQPQHAARPPAAKGSPRWGRWLLGILLAGGLAGGLAEAFGGSGSPSSPSVPAAYSQAIDSMTAHCTQNAAQLENMVAAAHGLEVKAGVTGESVTQLAVNLSQAVAAYKTPADCSQPFGAYVTMREGG